MIKFFSFLKPLKMLYDMRNNLGSPTDINMSELTKWLVWNGKETVEKYKEFEKSDFNKALSFSGKLSSLILLLEF